MKKILIITILSVFCASLCEAQIKADIQKQQQQKVEQQKQREQAIKAEAEKKKREQEQKAERQKRLQYEREKAKAQGTTNPCVEINGVIWATRNVGQPGEFVANPENLGSSYNWKAASTACPTGWRLPTKGELELLLKVSKSVTSKNDVSGQLYDNSLFFPCSAASLMGGSYGYYWSNNSNVALMTSTDKTWKQEIKTNVVAQNKYYVRCVADKVDSSYYQKQALATAEDLFKAGNYDEALNSYKFAGEAGKQSGYSAFKNKAVELISLLDECDSNTKALLLKAQQLNDTEEIRNLLSKCK